MAIKVVYIDDEVGLCQLFEDNFSTHEVEIVTFTNPDDALREIPKIKPKLVFIDYRLPKTSGELVAEEIDTSIPKFLVSGDLAVSPSKKFAGFFCKPFDFNEIEAVIDSHLDS